MEWVESVGDTLELAKEQALDSLGVAEDDAEFEVVSDVKTGVFGRIKEPARVKARVRPRTPRAKEDAGRGDRSGGRSQQSRAKRSVRTRSNQDETRDRQANTTTSTEQTQRSSRSINQNPRDHKGKVDQVNENQEVMPLVDQADLAEEFVRGLAEKFGLSVSFRRQHLEGDEIRITVEGENLGPMVGRRGITASAIDDLVRTFLQRRAGSARNGRIRVDIGGVVAKRNSALVRFAREQAHSVQSTGVPRSLEPMNANDRKVVHDAVEGSAGVTTVSKGDEPRRYVVIVPD